MSPICIKCSVMMRCHKNGQAVVINGCRLYHGDTYKCPECGIEVVAGFGPQPIREDWMPDWGTVVANEKNFGIVLQVEDL